MALPRKSNIPNSPLLPGFIKRERGSSNCAWEAIMEHATVRLHGGFF